MNTLPVFEINESAKFSYDLLLNWALTSTKEVDMGYLWYILWRPKNFGRHFLDIQVKCK
jgi:hypothetical protein